MVSARKGMIAALTALVLAACGGGVASSDPGTSSSSGGSSSGGSSSGSSGASSSSSGGSCVDDALPVARACVPSVAKANAPLTLGIEGQGCEGCGQTLQGCSVEVKGTSITLSLSMEKCTLPPDTGCATICKLPQTTCAIPALAAGSYTVELITNAPQPGVIPASPRQLVVEDGASATSCALTQGPPPPISTDKYSKSCNTPSDCTAVLSGDVCARSCQNAAIATSAVDAYEAERRALTSQCPPREYPPGGPCPQPLVGCSNGQCVLGP